jgi:hypothetical protein
VESDHARSTTRTSIAGLPPAIRDALIAHAEARVASYHVGLVAPDGDAAREALRDAVRAARAA